MLRRVKRREYEKDRCNNICYKIHSKLKIKEQRYIELKGNVPSILTTFLEL